MTLHVLSYGAGAQSTAALVLMATGALGDDWGPGKGVALFANVGDDSEHPATIRYLRDVAMPYAEAHGIELGELQRHRRDGSTETLFGRLMHDSPSVGIPMRIGKHGAPGNRNCTLDFKIRPIAKELKRRGATADDPAVVALGISLDEHHRMRSESGIPHETLTYPLIDLRMDRAACLALIEREGLPAPGRSSCWFCPYFTVKARTRQLKHEPELFERTAKLEDVLNARRAKLGKDPLFMSSRLIPLREAITASGQVDMFEDGAACEIAGYCGA